MTLNIKNTKRWWLKVPKWILRWLWKPILKKDGDSKSNKTQLNLTKQWPIDIGAVLETQTDMTRRWPIDIGATPTQTQTDKMMTDRYRCGPNSKTQTDRMTTDRYGCGPRNRIDMTRRWPIDIGAAPTQTKLELTRWWSIDIGAVPTQAQTTKW